MTKLYGMIGICLLMLCGHFLFLREQGSKHRQLRQLMGVKKEVALLRKEGLIISSGEHSKIAVPFRSVGTIDTYSGLLILNEDAETIGAIKLMSYRGNPVWKCRMGSLLEERFRGKKITDMNHQLTGLRILSKSISDSEVDLDDSRTVEGVVEAHLPMKSLEKILRETLLNEEMELKKRRALFFPESALELILQNSPSREIPSTAYLTNSIFPSENRVFSQNKDLGFHEKFEFLNQISAKRPENCVEIDPGSSERRLFFLEEVKRYSRRNAVVPIQIHSQTNNAVQDQEINVLESVPHEEVF